MSDATTPMPPLSTGARLKAKASQRARLWALLYALMLPTIVGVLIFTYLPNIEVVKYAFYRWDGSQIEEYRGVENFKQAITNDPLFWDSFKLVGILLLANLLKMWPSIFVAIAIHRLTNQRYQYLYRVLFVIPMVIPGLVWLLIWKTIFTSGMLNDVLNATGLMWVLQQCDGWLPSLHQLVTTTAYSFNSDSPVLSAILQPLRIIPTVFGSSWGLALFGVVTLVASGGLGHVRRRWFIWLMLTGIGAFLWGPIRMPLLIGGAFVLSEWLFRRDRIDGPAHTNRIGIIAIAVAAVTVMLTEIWTEPIGAPLADGNPPWLGHSKLIIPSLILWGFPWVGTIGVLIYLAGLQTISSEVYEAADLDGVGFWGKIFKIELPLILTQVRINLIFMTIGTLTDYAFYLLLLGAHGGPGNKGMVPGLYMYKKAFLDGEFGYACTLGMCMFVIILAITVFYQKYVRVEK